MTNKAKELLSVGFKGTNQNKAAVSDNRTELVKSAGSVRE